MMISQNSIELHETSWNLVNFHDNCMGFHGIGVGSGWDIMQLRDIITEVSGISLSYHRFS